MESSELTAQVVVQQPLERDHRADLITLYAMSDIEAWGRSDEDICAATSLFWRSAAYSHYVLGVRRVYRQDEFGSRVPDYIEFTFTCKYDPTRCKSKARKRSATGHGTTNMRNAIERCDQRRGAPDSLANSQPVLEFTQLRFRALLCLWCAVSRRPFHSLVDPLFIDIVRLLRDEAVVPSPHTISSDLARIYNRVSVNARESFMEIDTGVHLAIDGWSSPLVASFLGIIAFWRQNGKIWSVILEFVHLTERHTGAYMAERTLECLERFGLRNQIKSICLDNAGNNDTFTRKIAPSLPNFQGEKSRIRCLPHITNLIAKAFMAPYIRPSPKKRKIATESTANKRPTAASLPAAVMDTPPGSSGEPEPTLDDLDVVLDLPEDLDEGKELFDDGVVQEAVMVAIDEMKRIYGLVVPAKTLADARDILTKVNGFAHHVHKSPPLQGTFHQVRGTCADKLSTKEELPEPFVSTRWDSQLGAAESHRNLRPVIEMVTANSANRVTRYKMKDEEWNLLDELCECLVVFRELTLFFSQSGVLTIHEVIPQMLLLRFRLELMRDDADGELHPATRVAAHAALVVLKKYLGLMEKSHIYWMAVALCPWYKLDWFLAQGYPESRVQAIRQMLLDEFARYKPNSIQSCAPPPPPLFPSARLKSRWMKVPNLALAPALRIAPAYNSLLAYLASPPLTKDDIERTGGLMQYWIAEKNRGSDFADMALDILTAPASSVDAERAFSGGRMTVNYRQHRMSLGTFRAKMAVGSWYGTPLLDNIDEVAFILGENGAECDKHVELEADLES